MGRRGVRRRIIVATAVVVALAVIGLVVRQVWLNDTARVVDADEAVQRFRDQTTLPATTEPVISSSTTVAPSFTTAEPGVYRYTTVGEEHIDVLGGAQHDYPAETTITVTPSGCGVQFRWDLLRERYEEYHLCATPQGIELAPLGAYYHEFFQHGMREEMTCDRAVLLITAEPAAGAGQQLACMLNDRPWAPTWKVMERTILHVAGTDVEATHVRMSVEDADQYWEHAVADWWFDDHGLPVKMTSHKESKSSSDLIGDVVYSETYTVELASFTPLQ